LQTYCDANKYTPKKPRKFDVSSKWILSRLETVKRGVTENLEELKPHIAASMLEEFFLNDLSRWYGHIIRDHIKPDLDSEHKDAMLYTFYKVCFDALKLLAPFVPFVTEDLYQSFFKAFEKEESIHFFDWPKVEKKLTDEKLEKQMNLAKQIVEVSNSMRYEKNIKLKYVLPSLSVDGNDEMKEAAKNLKEIIKEMANVKEIKIEEVKEGKEIENGKLYLNTEVTEKIKNEWLLSELTRNVQDARKKMNLEIKDKVELYLPEEDLFKENKKNIESKTGSKIVFGKILSNKSEFEFENKKYEFGIKK
jgi:isoleucyl-tRNA synthetase